MRKAFAAVIPLAAVIAAQQGSVEPCGPDETWIAADSVFFRLPLPAPPPPSSSSTAPAPAFIVPPPSPSAIPRQLAPAKE